MFLTDKAEAVFSDWNWINSRLFVVRLRLSFGARNDIFDKGNLFVVLGYTPVDCGTERQEGDFCAELATRYPWGGFLKMHEAAKTVGHPRLS